MEGRPVSVLQVDPHGTGQAVAALLGQRHADQLARLVGTYGRTDPVLLTFARGLVDPRPVGAPELLTRTQAARRCNVEPRTIDRWRTQGLTARKSGGRVLIAPDDLERWLRRVDNPRQGQTPDAPELAGPGTVVTYSP